MAPRPPPHPRSNRDRIPLRRGERTLRIPSHSGLDTHSRFVEAFNRAADSLAARESEFRLFARATGDAVWDWNIAKDEVVWIHGGRSVLGADVDSFVEPSSWWLEG